MRRDSTGPEFSCQSGQALLLEEVLKAPIRSLRYQKWCGYHGYPDQQTDVQILCRIQDIFYPAKKARPLRLQRLKLLHRLPWHRLVSECDNPLCYNAEQTQRVLQDVLVAEETARSRNGAQWDSSTVSDPEDQEQRARLFNKYVIILGVFVTLT